jgi:transcription antitermination factor NusG
MFVFLDIEAEGTNALRWTEGTYGLVQFGGEPISVPDSLIHELKAALDKIMVESRIKKESYTRGDRVRIVGGLFDGYEAIFDTRLPGKDRVQVLLAFLSDQPKRLLLDETEITKVSGGSKKNAL